MTPQVLQRTETQQQILQEASVWQKPTILTNVSAGVSESSSYESDPEDFVPQVKRFPGVTSPVWPLFVPEDDSGDVDERTKGFEDVVRKERFRFRENSWAVKKRIVKEFAGKKWDLSVEMGSGKVASVEMETGGGVGLGTKMDGLSIGGGIPRLRGGGEVVPQQRDEQGNGQPPVDGSDAANLNARQRSADASATVVQNTSAIQQVSPSNGSVDARQSEAVIVNAPGAFMQGTLQNSTADEVVPAQNQNIITEWEAQQCPESPGTLSELSSLQHDPPQVSMGTDVNISTKQAVQQPTGMASRPNTPHAQGITHALSIQGNADSVTPNPVGNVGVGTNQPSVDSELIQNARPQRTTADNAEAGESTQSDDEELIPPPSTWRHKVPTSSRSDPDYVPEKHSIIKPRTVPGKLASNQGANNVVMPTGQTMDLSKTPSPNLDVRETPSNPMYQNTRKRPRLSNPPGAPSPQRRRISPPHEVVNNLQPPLNPSELQQLSDPIAALPGQTGTASLPHESELPGGENTEGPTVRVDVSPPPSLTPAVGNPRGGNESGSRPQLKLRLRIKPPLDPSNPLKRYPESTRPSEKFGIHQRPIQKDRQQKDGVQGRRLQRLEVHNGEKLVQTENLSLGLGGSRPPLAGGNPIDAGQTQKPIPPTGMPKVTTSVVVKCEQESYENQRTNAGEQVAGSNAEVPINSSSLLQQDLPNLSSVVQASADRGHENFRRASNPRTSPNTRTVSNASKLTQAGVGGTPVRSAAAQPPKQWTHQMQVQEEDNLPPHVPQNMMPVKVPSNQGHDGAQLQPSPLPENMISETQLPLSGNPHAVVNEDGNEAVPREGPEVTLPPTRKSTKRRFPKLLDVDGDGVPQPVGVRFTKSEEEKEALLSRIQILALRAKKELLEKEDAIAIRKQAGSDTKCKRSLLERRALKHKVEKLRPDAVRSIVRIVTQKPDFRLTSTPIEVKLDLDSIDDELIRQIEILVHREENPGTLPIAPDLQRLRKMIRKGKRKLALLEKGLTHDQVTRLEALKPLKS
eukprot:Plantae.Rhodophyta-Hildenbrandia_rubra.ctg497.p1 GENE.Plantae.Rhodophyta-Hildenbrandia_rubra.ctg497~~Plantae.Rhodophyta-Hildenbrandia_rubra.ctg497.p1  ORF type:complete len:1027 (+),score=199.51 Plantae.Rhodophyta-Hildenbrandia_rubra.ctg497:304-3384(+)